MELFPFVPSPSESAVHKITRCTLAMPGLAAPCRLAVAADLHGGAWRDLLPALQTADLILIPGDLLDRRRRDSSRAVAFARAAAGIAPVFYSVGNHEARYAENFPERSREYWRAIRKAGVVVLDNRFVREERTGLVLGGLSERPAGGAKAHGKSRGEPQPAAPKFLARMACQPAPRVLLCHRPEDYRRTAEACGFELVLAGHAHGGQIAIGGQGLYAPGQGIFPRDTAGVHPGRAGGVLLISRGLTNTVAPLPRWGNPTELLLVELMPG